MLRTKWMFVVALVLMLSASGWCVILFDSDYLVQTYAVFEGGTTTTDMTFVPSGDLYITYQGPSQSSRDGVIYKVTPNGTASLFMDGFVHPKSITWGGGTAYGDYLYITDQFEETTWSRGEVTRLSLDGTKSPFAGNGFAQPVPLEIDRHGNFGGYMYVGSGVDDRLHRVMPDGSTAEFYYFGAYALDGTPWGMAFASPGTYGDLMYVATAFPDASSLSGVLAFHPDGTFTEFAPEILNAWDIEFDSTGLMFGGALYAYGNNDSGRRIWRINADGSTDVLAHLLDIDGGFTFGPDGSMYICETVGGTTVISRVFVPEPASLVLFGLGVLMLRRRR